MSRAHPSVVSMSRVRLTPSQAASLGATISRIRSADRISLAKLSTNLPCRAQSILGTGFKHERATAQPRQMNQHREVNQEED
jgi:hypothetical protein